MITHVYPVSLGIKGRHLNTNLFFEVHFSAWPRNWPCKFLLCGQTAVTTLQQGRSLSLTLPQSSPVSLLNKWGKRMQAACVGRWWQGGGGWGFEGICCSVTAHKGQKTTGYESGSKLSGLFSFISFHLIVRSNWWKYYLYISLHHF